MDANKISYSGLAGRETLLLSGLPILTYHLIGPRPRGVKWRSLYLHPALFSRQLRELATAGFTSARLSAPRPAAGNPDRKIAITFDDGYANVLTHAAPALAREGFTAIQFIVAGEIGGRNTWDVLEGEVPAPLMTDEQIREWLRLGHEIGSHTLSHPRLPRLSSAEQRRELETSKQQLEDRFGVPVHHFCYPYGDYDDVTLGEVARAGYATACTHRTSGVNTAATLPHALLRLEARYPKRNLKTLLARFRTWWRLGP